VIDPNNYFEADAVMSVEPTIINRLVTGRSNKQILLRQQNLKHGHHRHSGNI
jgi:hypothetical protein